MCVCVGGGGGVHFIPALVLLKAIDIHVYHVFHIVVWRKGSAKDTDNVKVTIKQNGRKDLVYYNQYCQVGK